MADQTISTEFYAIYNEAVAAFEAATNEESRRDHWDLGKDIGADLIKKRAFIAGYMTRAYAHRLIAAAKIVDNIKEASPIGDTPPAESIARPLTELPEDEQGEAWQEALDTAPKDKGGAPVVTAKHVEAVVAKKLGKPAPIWREIEKHIDAASNLFGAHAADCDEAWEVKRALEVAVERFSYYVRNVEAT